jgi:hypothetical protein
MIQTSELFKRITQLEQFFLRSKRYSETMKRAVRYFEAGELEKCNLTLDELPSEMQLLDELTNKIKDKPVFRTLKKIANQEVTSVFEEMKGYFSLGTHITVECEKGNE